MKKRGLIIFCSVVGCFIVSLVIVALVIASNPTLAIARSEAGDIISNSTPADFRNPDDELYVEHDNLPELVSDTFVVSEDRDFYKHDGIAYKAKNRAIIEVFLNENTYSGGGMTITEQLVENIYMGFGNTTEDKLKMIFLAQEIEKMYTKEDIMEFYVNNLHYGNEYYGIGSAAKGYLGKDVSELTTYETVFLCSIPNNPTLYDPYTNADAVAKRAERLLEQLRECEYIDDKEYETALEEKIVIVEQTPSE